MNAQIIEKFIDVVEQFTKYMEIQLKIQSALYEELLRKTKRIRILEDVRRGGDKESKKGI